MTCLTCVRPGPGVMRVGVEKISGLTVAGLTDTLSVEEPLEIRLVSDDAARGSPRVVSVTMRTPGDDHDLAVGFLFTERIISEPDEIEEVRSVRRNVVEVTLQRGLVIDLKLLDRHSFVASSCGVCGKRSIEALHLQRKYEISIGELCLSPDLVHALPDALRAGQAAFERTGGIHAAGLFDATGKLLRIREDVGRHNALDKLIGAEFRAGTLPLTQRIVLLSGRASFELVQKAACAGVPILAAIGAPSSLAVQLARDCGMTLLGFVRDHCFNVYSGSERFEGL